MKIAAVTGIIALLWLFYQLDRNEKTPDAPKPVISLETPNFIHSTYRQKLDVFKWDNSWGQSLTSDQLKGQWTLINFWAYWCYPCHVELPLLQKASESFVNPKLNILLVNVDHQREQLEKAQKFLSENQISLNTLFDTQGLLSKQFGVGQYPYHILINPKGEMRYSAPGAIDWSDQSVKASLGELLSQDLSKGSTVSTK